MNGAAQREPRLDEPEFPSAGARLDDVRPGAGDGDLDSSAHTLQPVESLPQVSPLIDDDAQTPLSAPDRPLPQLERPWRVQVAWIVGLVILAFGGGWISAVLTNGTLSEAASAPAKTADRLPVASHAPTGPSSAHRLADGRARPQPAASAKPAAMPAARSPEPRPPSASVVGMALSDPSARHEPEPPLRAWPDTPPASIAGWRVSTVSGGRATLQGPDRAWTVEVGDTVPELGRVSSVVRWGGFWVVATSRGLITDR